MVPPILSISVDIFGCDHRHYQSTLAVCIYVVHTLVVYVHVVPTLAVYVYVVLGSEFPIVPFYPHDPHDTLLGPALWRFKAMTSISLLWMLYTWMQCQGRSSPSTPPTRTTRSRPKGPDASVHGEAGGPVSAGQCRP